MPPARTSRRGVTVGLGLGLLAAGLLAAACGSNVESLFPPGLEPLGENQASPPDPLPGDPCPETFSAVSGHTDEYDWMDARACVHGSLAATWAALRDPEVCADRRTVSSWSVDWDVEPDYEVSFVIHNVVEDLITVEFDITWRQGLGEGTDDEPKVVLARYQKTYGTSFISYNAGSVVARARDDGTTELELMEQLDAVSAGVPEIERYLRDFYASILARVHGQPLPTY